MHEQISLEIINLRLGRKERENGQYKYEEVAFSPTSPQIDNTARPFRQGYEVPHVSSGTRKTNWHKIFGLRWPTGWKRGTTVSALTVFVILIVNITITAVCNSKLRSRGLTTLIAPLITGDCESIKKAGIGIHLGINIVSTALLGASNYCMQTISAPTREDANKAHRKFLWVDIGIPSIRNLSYIQKRRLLVWMLLGATSIPLHLVYNSTFFVSTISNLYPVWYADASFANGAPFNESFFRQNGLDDVDPWTVQERIMAGGIYQNLTNNQCIEAYAKTIIGDKGHLVLVVNRPQNCSVFTYSDMRGDGCGDTSDTSLYNMFKYNNTFEPVRSPHIKNWYYWICSQPHEYSTGKLTDVCSDGGWKKQLNADSWTVDDVDVNYCLSEKANGQCQLNVAMNLLFVVIAFNLAKLIIITIMATTSLINHNPLVTLGDVIASFIQQPDPTTGVFGLSSVAEVKKLKYAQKLAVAIVPYRAKSRRWAAAVGKPRWIIATASSFLALFIIILLLVYASTQLQQGYGRGGLQALWNFGFGTVTPYNIIQGWGVSRMVGDSAVIVTVLIVNLPQLLLSFIYLIFNAILTSMTTAHEWSTYAHQTPQQLRVSFPEPGQRSTFFLQLPYQYSLPMMAFSALIHWLISQSIFIAQVVERQLWTYKSAETPVEDGSYGRLTTAAFSPMAIILTCAIFFVVFMAVIGIGMFHLRAGIPLGGTCSLVISAACHVLEGTLSSQPLKWGVVSGGNPELQGIAGHCSFSNENVELPQEGKLYI